MKKMIIVTVHIPRFYVEILDMLVKQKLFPNRGEAIRAAIRDFIKRELAENENQ